MRVLGLDFGEKRFGIALSDGSGRFARPLEVASGKHAVLERIARIIDEVGVGLIVLGLPRNMDGSLGPKAREVLRFAEVLRGRFQVPVKTWDERLTTIEAERYLREAGVQSRERRGRVDQVAAQILLQSFLDSRATPGSHPEGSEAPLPGSGDEEHFTAR